MWRHRVLAVAVVPLGVIGGVLALSVRGMHVERGAAAGFYFVWGLAIVQAWIVASGIARAGILSGDIRTACSQGAQGKFKAVLLMGVSALVSVMPMHLAEPSPGRTPSLPQSIIGGVVFSTAGALIVLPVLILWMSK